MSSKFAEKFQFSARPKMAHYGARCLLLSLTFRIFQGWMVVLFPRKHFLDRVSL
jgi:hypothetical protein